MTIQEFQLKNSEWLKTLLSDSKGQEFLNVLAAMKPSLAESPHIHLYADAKGQVRGYESCIRNMIYLTSLPKPSAQPEANYGINEKSETVTV